MRSTESVLPSEIVTGINNCSVESLFDFYRKCNFLYAEKYELLSPVIHEIVCNWTKAINAGDKLLWFLTMQSIEGELHASEANWRSTWNTWTAQHLVSSGGKALPALIESATYYCENHSYANLDLWFRPDNRFPSAVFGGVRDAVGAELTASLTYNYHKFPYLRDASSPEFFQVVKCSQNEGDRVEKFICSQRGIVFVRCEEISDVELNCSELGEIYAAQGLSRTRDIWIAEDMIDKRIIGVLLCYYGPTGFNLSLLENRCEIILREDLGAIEVFFVTRALLSAVVASNPNRRWNLVPIVCSCDKISDALSKLGAAWGREYQRLLVLAEGKRALVDYFVALFRNKGIRR